MKQVVKIVTILSSVFITLIQAQDGDASSPTTQCTMDVFTCDNGDVVVRNPLLNCAFNACADGTEIHDENAPTDEDTTEAPPVDATTEAPPADATTEAPADATTEAPADATTEAPPTDATTEAPPADATTEAPADATTEAPPADAATEAPPTDATTEAPPADATTTEAPPADATTEAPPADATTEAPAADANTTPEATTAAPSQDLNFTEWETVQDLTLPILQNSITSAFTYWDKTICDSLETSLSSAQSRYDDTSSPEADNKNITEYSMGVNVKCVYPTSKELFEGTFHLVVKSTSSENSFLQSCVKVMDTEVQNWLAMKADNAICESPSMKLELESESLSAGLAAATDEEDTNNNSTVSMLENLNKKTAALVAIAGLVLVALFAAIGTAIRRQNVDDQATRSILTATDSDDESSISPSVKVDEKTLDDEEDDVEGAEEDIFNSKDEKQTTSAENDMEEGTFMNSPDNMATANGDDH